MIGERFNQKNANVITWAKVETIKVPTLLMTGDCGPVDAAVDPAPAGKPLKHAEVKVIREAGHAPSWEQPEAFNAALLDFSPGIRAYVTDTRSDVAAVSRQNARST